MTNIVAAVITTIVTNWVSVGTFTPTSGWPQYDVQEARLQTNTVAIVEYKHQRKEVVLESCEGPKVAERKIEKPQAAMQIWPGLAITNNVINPWLGGTITNEILHLNTQVTSAGMGGPG